MLHQKAMLLRICLALLFSLFLFTGCSASSNESAVSGDANMASDQAAPRAEMNVASVGLEEANSAFEKEQLASVKEADLRVDSRNATEKRMVIYEARLTLVTADYTKARDETEQLVDQFGGYVVNASEYQTDERRGARMTVRIPQAQFTKFLQAIEGLALSVPQRNVEGKDVTEEYVDLSSRLKAKEAVEQRLYTLMEKADKVEDLLKISHDLGQVQQEIEQLKGKMRYLQDHVALSTVELNFIDSAVPAGGANTFTVAWHSFNQSWASLYVFARESFVFFSAILPFLIVIALFAVPLGWLLWRRIKLRHSETKPGEVNQP